MAIMKVFAASVALALVLASCSSSSKKSASAVSTTTTAAPTTTVGPSTTPPADTNEDSGGHSGGTDGGSTRPTPTTTVKLAVTSITGYQPVHVCADPQAPGVPVSSTFQLHWTTTGAVRVEIAIDNPNGPEATNLPPNGSYEVGAPCAPDTQTYYITAVGADGSRVRKSAVSVGK